MIIVIPSWNREEDTQLEMVLVHGGGVITVLSIAVLQLLQMCPGRKKNPTVLITFLALS